MDQQEIAEVMAKPYAQELLSSAIPARLAYIGVEGDPRVVPIGFLWDRDRLVVCSVPSMAKVRALYQQMARITIELTWAKLLDFETTLPKAVADLVAAHGREGA